MADLVPWVPDTGFALSKGARERRELERKYEETRQRELERLEVAMGRVAGAHDLSDYHAVRMTSHYHLIRQCAADMPYLEADLRSAASMMNLAVNMFIATEYLGGR